MSVNPRQEHVVIAQTGEELRLLLERAVNGEVTPRSSIEVAAATYLVCYVKHITAEEEDMFAPCRQGTHARGLGSGHGRRTGAA